MCNFKLTSNFSFGSIDGDSLHVYRVGRILRYIKGILAEHGLDSLDHAHLDGSAFQLLVRLLVDLVHGVLLLHLRLLLVILLRLLLLLLVRRLLVLDVAGEGVLSLLLRLGRRLLGAYLSWLLIIEWLRMMGLIDLRAALIDCTRLLLPASLSLLLLLVLIIVVLHGIIARLGWRCLRLHR